MSTSDRELLELAARAAGIKGVWSDRGQCIVVLSCTGMPELYWRPIEDDGDALRLAADLCINIEWFPGQKFVQACRFGIGEIIGWVDETERSGSLRRAITIAATKIGKSLEKSK